MSCPNCNAEMNTVSLDNQTVLHCSNCGSSFFEENGINRVSLASTLKLSEDKKSDEVSGQTKFCPKDRNILKPIITSFNEFKPVSTPIPPDVTLLQCNKCKGIFVFPDDLIKFKKAQEAKISYFKTWNIPLPSLQAIVVLTFIVAISATIFSRYIFFQGSSISQTKANDIIKLVSVSSSGHYLFISFKTQLPLRSEIVFKRQNGKVVKKSVSAKPTTLHYITVTDISIKEPVTYHIVLTDDSGKTIKTEEKKLESK